VEVLSGPGFGGWKNRRHSQASANGASGNIRATPMKMMMKKYGWGFIPVMLSGAKHLSIQTCFEKQPLTRDSPLRSK
jgi:hypothetical protein